MKTCFTIIISFYSFILLACTRKNDERIFPKVEPPSSVLSYVFKKGTEGYACYRIPALIKTKQGTLLAFAEGRKNNCTDEGDIDLIVKRSSDNGKTWGRLKPTSLVNPNSGTDAVTLQNGLQLIVYNPDAPGRDWWNGRGRLHVAVSDDGTTWRDVVVLENGGKEEFSYPSVIQGVDGRVHITYTYNRKNIKYVVLNN